MDCEWFLHLSLSMQQMDIQLQLPYRILRAACKYTIKILYIYE